MKTISYRPGTDDLKIWQSVYEENEYQLPDSMDGWLILDIGAHIGSFSMACHDRKAGRIIAFEPCRSARDCLVENAGYGWYIRSEAVDAHNGEAELRHHNLASGNSLHLTIGTTEKVKVLGFTELMNGATVSQMGVNEFDLVKLDCEWSEYPILLQSTIEAIRKGRRYLIESHLLHRHHEIRDRMDSIGFTCKRIKTEGKLQTTYWERRDA